MTEQFVASEWYKWDGGEMPVPEGTMVEVVHRGDKCYMCQAGRTYAEDWTHDDTDSDIIAYRIM